MGLVLNTAMFPRPVPPGYAANEVSFATTGDGRRMAYVVARPRAGGDPATGVALLLSHGNAEDLGSVAPAAAHLARALGVTVLSFDYAGYGASEGDPSEARAKADVETAARIVEHELGFPRDRTVLLGRSLGSGPACHLAALARREGRPYRGVALLSPLASAFHVVLPNRVLGVPLPGDAFRNLDLVRESAGRGLGCPVLVVHGVEDEVISVAHGRAIADAVHPRLRADPVFVPRAGHNDVELRMLERGDPWERVLRRFLDACDPASPSFAFPRGVAGVAAQVAGPRLPGSN